MRCAVTDIYGFFRCESTAPSWPAAPPESLGLISPAIVDPVSQPRSIISGRQHCSVSLLRMFNHGAIWSFMANNLITVCGRAALPFSKNLIRDKILTFWKQEFCLVVEDIQVSIINVIPSLRNPASTNICGERNNVMMSTSELNSPLPVVKTVPSVQEKCRNLSILVFFWVQTEILISDVGVELVTQQGQNTWGIICIRSQICFV